MLKLIVIFHYKPFHFWIHFNVRFIDKFLIEHISLNTIISSICISVICSYFVLCISIVGFLLLNDFERWICTTILDCLVILILLWEVLYYTRFSASNGELMILHLVWRSEPTLISTHLILINLTSNILLRLISNKVLPDFNQFLSVLIFLIIAWPLSFEHFRFLIVLFLYVLKCFLLVVECLFLHFTKVPCLFLLFGLFIYSGLWCLHFLSEYWLKLLLLCPLLIISINLVFR